MARTGRFRHAAMPGGQIVDLPYGDGRFGFTVFLPDAVEGLDGWLAGLSRSSWLEMTARMREASGELRLPRLDLAFSVDLRDALAGLGATAAFRPGTADFSPMTAERAAIFVASFVHQVVVKLDESGTRAAASTTITMPGAAAPGASFRMVVDHPFFFTIHGPLPEDLLFVGAVRTL